MSGMHWSRAIGFPIPAKNASDPAAEARILMTLADQAGIMDPLPQVERLLERERQLERLQMEAWRDAGERRAAALTELLASDVLTAEAVTRAARVYQETGAWLDHKLDSDPPRAAPAMVMLGEARSQLNRHAAMTLSGVGAGLYQRFAAVAAEQVAAVKGLAPLPEAAWASPDPAGVLIGAGRADDWMTLLKADQRFQTCWNAGWMLRRDGLGAEAILPGDRPRLAFLFKDWQAAQAGLLELRRLAEPLRLLKATQAGWGPGLWMASDYRDAPAARRLLAGLRRS